MKVLAKIYNLFTLPMMIIIVVGEFFYGLTKDAKAVMLADQEEAAQKLIEKWDRHLTPLSILFWLTIGVLIYLWLR